MESVTLPAHMLKEKAPMLRLLFVAAFVSALPMTLIADVLVLRNGSRIQGELLSVRGGVIEFEERRGSGSGRTVRVDRGEVLRIELDSYGNNDNYDRGGGFSGGRPSGLRERQVNVAANVAWNDSGIDVRPGQTVYFEARGEIRWGRDRRDGPEGENNSPNNPNRPIPSRAAGSLIGKVGNESSDSFYIGADSGPVRMRSGGRLYLGVNDDFLQDNSGSFQVVIRY
jgi:hypothetical protein